MTKQAHLPPAPSYLRLCPGEPFRIFFPLATLLGLSGVSLWPLYFTGLHKFYPGPMHARLMIQGFLAGFVLGFLGTAVPRLLAAPRLRAIEVWTLVALHSLVAGLHIGHQMFAGDVAFVAELALFAAVLALRVRARSELPPPGFALVALGYLSGLIGTALWAGGLKNWVPGPVALLGQLWLHQGFGLLLILGIGTFLFPRFLGLPGVTPLDEERRASPAWRRRAAVALATGVALLATYWLEATHAASTSAALVRSVVAFAWLAATIPFHRTPAPTRTVPLAVNLALATVAAGLLFPLLWPSQRVAGLPMEVCSVFTLLTFTVATRVVLGHSGQEPLFRSSFPSLRTATILLLIATGMRAVGDFIPARASALNGASYLWMLAAAIWAGAILPNVRRARPDQ